MNRSRTGDEVVYFIQPIFGGPVKIGRTSGDPMRRLAELQTGCPVPLRLCGTQPGGLRRESELHRKFEADRISGEWFRPSAELASLIGTDLTEGERPPVDLLPDDITAIAQAVASMVAVQIADAMTPPSEGLLDAAAAAEILSVPKTWLLQEARDGRIPHLRLGRYVRFESHALAEWLDGRRRGPSGPRRIRSLRNASGHERVRGAS